MKVGQGLTNKISLEKGMIRKTSSPTVDYFLNRKAESELYQQFQTLPDQDFYLKPLTWGVDVDQHFFSTWTYYPNSYTLLDQPEKLSDPTTLTAMIKIIEAYHHLEVEMPFFEAREYLNKFVTKIQNPLVDLSSYQTKLDQIITRWYEPEFKVCLSHNDMVPGNFLFVDDQLKLIDFEYSCFNLALFDYAGVISETLPSNQIKAFVDLLGLSDKEKTKLKDLVFYAYLLWINWATYMYEKVHQPVYQEIVQLMNQKLQNFAKLPF